MPSGQHEGPNAGEALEWAPETVLQQDIDNILATVDSMEGRVTTAELLALAKLRVLNSGQVGAELVNVDHSVISPNRRLLFVTEALIQKGLSEERPAFVDLAINLFRDVSKDASDTSRSLSFAQSAHRQLESSEEDKVIDVAERIYEVVALDFQSSLALISRTPICRHSSIIGSAC